MSANKGQEVVHLLPQSAPIRCNIVTGNIGVLE